MERLTIYLRGGQVIPMKADKFEVTINGDVVQRITWTGTCVPELLYFDSLLVDCVTVEAVE